MTSIEECNKEIVRLKRKLFHANDLEKAVISSRIFEMERQIKNQKRNTRRKCKQLVKNLYYDVYSARTKDPFIYEFDLKLEQLRKEGILNIHQYTEYTNDSRSIFKSSRIRQKYGVE